MNSATTKTGWTVVTETGEQMTFACHKMARRIAKALQEGRTGSRTHAAPIHAWVVPA